jgi:hypothetical protein
MLWALAGLAAQASPIDEFWTQGRLVDASGGPVNGDVALTFAIWDAASGGSELWSQSVTTPVEQGYYAVSLGPVNAAVRADPETFLEVRVDGTPVGPMQPIKSPPWQRVTQTAPGVQSASFTVGSGDSGRVFLISGASVATLPALGPSDAGFSVTLKRTGTSNIRVSPSSGTIEGATQQWLLDTGSSQTVVFDGTNWHVTHKVGRSGPTADLPSCKAILDASLSTGNGTYTIDPDGPGGSAAFSAYCDMAGGGWTHVTAGVPIEFNTCGATGATGPTQSQCNAQYASNPFLNGKVTVTSGRQQWVVPVTGTYRFEVWGANGGAAGTTQEANGGNAGFVRGDINLTAGDVLYLTVGQRGVNGSTDGPLLGGAGGFGGGGNGGNGQRAQASYGLVGGGGGGGASDVRLNANSLGARVAVAAGGGGGSRWPPATLSAEIGHGGAGGGATGSDGTSNDGAACTGDGGTPSQGGGAGQCYASTAYGTAGASGQGGNGGNDTSGNNGGGGGGGGGYFGGGGGSGTSEGGGGGGSSYTGGLANITNTANVNSASGKITILFR